MYFFLELFLHAHVTNSVNSITSYGTGRDAMYIMRGVILEDIAPPPCERFGPLRCPCHWVPTRSSLSAVWAVHTGVWLKTLVLGHTCWCWVQDTGASHTHWCLVQNIGVGSYCIHILVNLPGVFCVCGGCQQWDSPVILALCFPCFDVLCTVMDNQSPLIKMEIHWWLGKWPENVQICRGKHFSHP